MVWGVQGLICQTAGRQNNVPIASVPSPAKKLKHSDAPIDREDPAAAPSEQHWKRSCWPAVPVRAVGGSNRLINYRGRSLAAATLGAALADAPSDAELRRIADPFQPPEKDENRSIRTVAKARVTVPPRLWD